MNFSLATQILKFLREYVSTIIRHINQQNKEILYTIWSDLDKYVLFSGLPNNFVQLIPQKWTIFVYSTIKSVF